MQDQWTRPPAPTPLPRRADTGRYVSSSRLSTTGRTRSSSPLFKERGPAGFCPKCRRYFPKSRRVCPADGSFLSDPPSGTIEVGTVLKDRYSLKRALGEGGMAKVYEAVDLQTHSSVAVKILDRKMLDDPEQIEQFFGEARILKNLRHPNIVDLMDFGQARDGTPFIVMELLVGIDLYHILKVVTRFTPGEAMGMCHDLSSALLAAHSIGVVHGDLKPENVMLVRDADGSVRPRLLDFGVGQATWGVRDSGAIKGTPTYMPPERINGEPLTERGDLYSLGIMVYELINGAPPFTSRNPMKVIRMHLDDRPAPLVEQPGLEALDPSIAGLVARLIAKTPTRRPTSAEQVRAEVRRIAPLDPTWSQRLADIATKLAPIDASDQVPILDDEAWDDDDGGDATVADLAILEASEVDLPCPDPRAMGGPDEEIALDATVADLGALSKGEPATTSPDTELGSTSSALDATTSPDVAPPPATKVRPHGKRAAWMAETALDLDVADILSAAGELLEAGEGSTVADLGALAARHARDDRGSVTMADIGHWFTPEADEIESLGTSTDVAATIVAPTPISPQDTPSEEVNSVELFVLNLEIVPPRDLALVDDEVMELVLDTFKETVVPTLERLGVQAARLDRYRFRFVAELPARGLAQATRTLIGRALAMASMIGEYETLTGIPFEGHLAAEIGPMYYVDGAQDDIWFLVRGAAPDVTMRLPAMAPKHGLVVGPECAAIAAGGDLVLSHYDRIHIRNCPKPVAVYLVKEEEQTDDPWRHRRAVR